MLAQYICAQCGAAFTATVRRDAVRRFCSHACGLAFHHTKTAPRFTFTCAQCGTAFEGRPLRNAINRFCSDRCCDDFNSLKQRQGRTPRQPKRISNCALCGTLFAHPRAQQRVYCSHACRAEARRRQTVTAAEAPNVRRSARRSAARDALKHYGVACQVCGWNRGRCQVAHRHPRAQGGSDSISNLAVLCPNCHWLLDHDGLTPVELSSLA